MKSATKTGPKALTCSIKPPCRLRLRIVNTSNKQNAPIIVTGCQGQLGYELCRQLGTEAIGLDLPEFDLCDRQTVFEKIESLRPRAVINTAAYTAVDRAEDEPEICRAVNVAGVANLVDACRATDATLVQISTDYVFGGTNVDVQSNGPTQRNPFRETDPPSPRDEYAQSKFEAELIAAAMGDGHLVVRTCGLYGHGGPRSPGNFPKTMLRLAQRGQTIRVVDDQWVTPSYVPHVARAIAFLLAAGHRGTFHVVNHGQTTWHGFAQELFRLLDYRVDLEPIATTDYPTRAWRPPYSVLDTSKYDRLPGHPAMPPWRDALRDYLDNIHQDSPIISQP